MSDAVVDVTRLVEEIREKRTTSTPTNKVTIMKEEVVWLEMEEGKEVDPIL